MINKPRLFGLTNSNRDFSLKDTWGKNQFNSSFPIALCCYMASKGIDVNYLISKIIKLNVNPFLSMKSLVSKQVAKIYFLHLKPPTHLLQNM